MSGRRRYPNNLKCNHPDCISNDCKTVCHHPICNHHANIGLIVHLHAHALMQSFVCVRHTIARNAKCKHFTSSLWGESPQAPLKSCRPACDILTAESAQRTKQRAKPAPQKKICNPKGEPPLCQILPATKPSPCV